MCVAALHAAELVDFLIAGDPLDIFGFLDGGQLESGASDKKGQNGKSKEETDEKQREKIREMAAREIKKIINSFPDLSFLQNIQLTH